MPLPEARCTTCAAGQRNCTPRAWARAASALCSSAWRGLYRWLGREAWVALNPVDGVRRRSPKPLPKALSVDLAMALGTTWRSRDPAAVARSRPSRPVHGRVALRARLAGGRTRGARRAAAQGRAGWIDLHDARPRCWARAASGAACRSGRRAGCVAGLAAGAGRLARTGRTGPLVSRRGTRLSAQPGAGEARTPRRCAPGCPRTCTRTCCAIPSPRTCCSPAATCVRCRNCWATPTSRPRRSTRGSTSGTCPRSTTRPIRAPGANHDGRASSSSRHEDDQAARRQGALAAAPPPLGVSGQRWPRAAPTRARPCACRRADGQLPGLGRVQPELADPRARLELRRSRAHRRRLLRAPHRAARSRCASAWPIDSDGVRLIHGEADGLPGLIVDRYGDVLVRAVPVARAPSAGSGVIADALLAATGCARFYERSDAGVRELEGLQPRRAGCAATGGATERDDPRARLAADAGRGRGPQDRLLPRPARQPRALRRTGAPVRLRACSTATATPAASAWPRWRAARRGDERRLVGARRWRAPRARRAQRLRRRARHECVGGRRQPARCASLRKQGRSFDAIVLDPPKFAPTAAHAERAARAYKDINRLALQAARRRAGCCSRSRARAASAPSCSTRSSPARGSTPGWTACIARAPGSRARPSDDASTFPRAST